MFVLCLIYSKNRISQLEKEISKKDEIISFLTEQLLVKNAFAIPLRNQNQERRSANNNTINDSTESEILVNGISEKGLSRKQIIFPAESPKKY